MQAVGDNLIVPNEFFTAKIAVLSILPWNTAKATILNDDGALRNDVTINGLGVLDPQLANLLTQDIDAAVGRIEQALHNEVPPLTIDVVFGSTPGTFAATGPVYSKFFVTAADGKTKIQLPNALYEKLFSSSGSTNLADMVLHLDLNKVAKFYSGKFDASDIDSGIDVTTVLAHEILHGLGFGSNVNTDAGESPWLLLTKNGGRFNGSQAIDANVPLAADFSHLASSSDLMGSGVLEPNTPISDLDVAIMQDLGLVQPIQIGFYQRMSKTVIFQEPLYLETPTVMANSIRAKHQRPPTPRQLYLRRR